MPSIPPLRKRRLAIAATICALHPPLALTAQQLTRDTVPHRDSVAITRRDVIGSVAALGVAFALDRPMRAALRERGPDGPLTHALSVTGNGLGVASHLVPALVGSFVIARVAQSHTATWDVLDAAATYAAADITESILKGSVGRERPYVHGDPTRFHPFTSNGNYVSFPSAHVTHIASIASAVAMDVPRPWMRDLAVGATLLVSWQRVHADEHWTSDVVAGALIADLMSREIVPRLHRLR